MADLNMLEKTPENLMYFTDTDTDFIHVDGATDEGPGIKEVQFLWTERHWKKAKLLTMVTTRCSGDSYLNRVELQNGHLSRAHSNLFLPSNYSSAIDKNGKIQRKAFANGLVKNFL